MAKKNDAKRAAKKHAKEKKRQKKLAARRSEQQPAPLYFRPSERWRPTEHGIEGLARLMGISQHGAATRAEELVKEGHQPAEHTWHPSRVAALSTEALLAELARRGVTVDADGFRALAAPYASARALAAERWYPLLPPDAGPHDRDLLSEAAVVLWVRWYHDRACDEDIETRFDRLGDALVRGEADSALQQLLDLLDDLRAEGGPARLARALPGLDAFEQIDEILADIAEADEPMPELARHAGRLRALRDHTADPDERYLGTLNLARLLELAHRPADAVDELLREAAGEPVAAHAVGLLGEAAAMVLHLAWIGEADPVLAARVLDALRARLDATEGEARADLEKVLERLTTWLAEPDEPFDPDESAESDESDETAR